MAHLEDVTVEELRDALDEVERKRPTQRLMVAIAYKEGVTQTALADWYDVERKTVYNWLTRLEEGSDDLVGAARDENRPGRPRKLTDAEQRQLEDTLRSPPSEVGYEGATWTPELVHQYVRDEFGISYSEESCRRRMREAGVR